MSTIDTLEVAREMKAVGFTDGQAEALARTVGRLQAEGFADLASKSDLKSVELVLKADLKSVELVLKADLKSVELALQAELREAELRAQGRLAETRADLLKWTMGAIGLQTLVILGAVVALARALGG